MIILGIDPSSVSTGWAIIKTEKKISLLDYGLISPTGNMGTIQRLYFFSNELEKVINKHQPDKIAFEETIQASSFKALRVLARFSGVGLLQAYTYKKEEPYRYEPQVWKKLLGVGGAAKKPEIQLKICQKFELISDDKIEEYQKELTEIKKLEKANRSGFNITAEKRKIDTQEKLLKKKRSEVKKSEKEANKIRGFTEEERNERLTKHKNFAVDVQNMESDLEKVKEEFKTAKKIKANSKKEVAKAYDKVSVDIYSDSGVNPDIADSIGVALAVLHEK